MYTLTATIVVKKGANTNILWMEPVILTTANEEKHTYYLKVKGQEGCFLLLT